MIENYQEACDELVESLEEIDEELDKVCNEHQCWYQRKFSQILKRLFKYIGRVKSNDFLRKCISFNISITNVHQVDILFVKIDEPQYAKKNKIKTFPSVGLYRQGYNFS